MAMNDDAFARLVAEEVKNKVSKDKREYLMLPENWTRWQRALVVLDKNLQAQLEALDVNEAKDVARYEKLGDDGIRLLAEATADYENRRKKIERFKYHVENRVDEVTKMIALGVDSADEDIRTVDFLRKAIAQHQITLEELDMEATPVDQALWAALEGKWLFDKIDINDL